MIPSEISSLPVPSCTLGEQVAYPPRRIVELAGSFGERGIVHSICQQDFTGVIDAMARQILAAQTECSE